MNRTQKNRVRRAGQNSKSLTKNVVRLPEKQKSVKLPNWLMIGVMLGALAWGVFTVASMPKRQQAPAKVVAPAEAAAPSLSYAWEEGVEVSGE